MQRAESPGLASDQRGRLLFCRQQQRAAGRFEPPRLLRAGREIAPEQGARSDASSLRWRARTRTQRFIARLRLFQSPPGFRHLN